MSLVSYRRRFVAYLIDVLPLTALVAAVYYFTMGFDQVWERYRAGGPRGPHAAEFRIWRNEIRNVSGLLYIAYAALLESSSLQSTFGKRLLGLIVVNELGNRIGLGAALKRNFCKILSAIPCLWHSLRNLQSSDRRAWHDEKSGTHVILATDRLDQRDEPESLSQSHLY